MLDRKSTTSEYLHNLFLQNQLDRFRRLNSAVMIFSLILPASDLELHLFRISAFPRPPIRIRFSLSRQKKYFRKGSLSSHITRKSRYPKPRRNFYLIFNTSFGCMMENTIGAYVPHGIFLFNAAYFISVCSSAFQNFAIFSSIFSLLQIWKSFHSLGNTSWHCLSINRSSSSVITPLS